MADRHIIRCKSGLGDDLGTVGEVERLPDLPDINFNLICAKEHAYRRRQKFCLSLLYRDKVAS